MPSQLDSEQTAIQALRGLVDLTDARVLEVGCGKGRRTGSYAAAARWVVGIDPNAEELAAALQKRPTEPRFHVALIHARAEALPFPSETFDVAILGWTL
ncbi:MAG TPA: methyltransferase domain-containing protein [Chthonomonadaceae bacterium]|nr:methyltransferase domain-containing protein [Chthonomonadaceae bacterium]